MVSEENKPRRKVGQSIGLRVMTSQTKREPLLFWWPRSHILSNNAPVVFMQ